MMLFTPNTHTFLCDTVHHWTKNQDVRAAVSTSSQAAVAAKTCGAKHRQATDTLMITRHILYNSHRHPPAITDTINSESSYS